MVEWENLPEALRESNRNQIDHRADQKRSALAAFDQP
jgi:hypothetical protein